MKLANHVGSWNVCGLYLPMKGMKDRINKNLHIIAASERSERAATLIWPSRTAHLYMACFHTRFSLARDISFYEYEVHRSAVKRDSVRSHAGLPEI